MSDDRFQLLEQARDAGGIDAVLDTLVEQLREQKKYHELFEALKMKVRRGIGLPLLYHDSADELDEATRDQLEDGLIDACREVGMLLLDDGLIRDGYMYMRPVGDRRAVAEALNNIEADEDNLDDLIEITLNEGVDVRRGLGLVLENYGTCNSITMYETVVSHRPAADQRIAAGLLVEHLHGELLEAVKTDIGRQEGKQIAGDRLAELIAERDWLFADGAYHIDTTHLASVTRFARSLDDERLLRLALDLTEYGRRLSKQFQYEGDPPFTDIYSSHALFFQALLGENEDEAIAYFRKQATDSDISRAGTMPIEVYIALLSRLERYDEAIRASLELLPADMQPVGYAPSLIELSEKAGDYNAMLEHCRKKNDLLGFAAGLMKASGKK